MNRFVATVVVAVFLALTCPASGAADKTLQRVRGTVGVAPTRQGGFTAISGRIAVADNAFAITRAASNALLAFPDSTQIGLGPDTSVEVGAFQEAGGSAGAQVTLVQGTMRFDVRHPQGGHSNYTFVTPTSSIAVRGTIALIGVSANATTVACLACAAGDVNVTVGTQSLALVTGQTLTVTATGAVVTGSVTASTLSAFSNAGLSTSATAGSPFTAGVTSAAATGSGGAAAGAAAGSTTAVVTGAAAAAAVGAAVAAGSGSTPQPTPTGTIHLSSKPAATTPPAPVRGPAIGPPPSVPHR